MRLKICSLFSIIFLSGCPEFESQPKLGPIKECRLITAEKLEDSYFYCTMNDGSSFEERIKLSSIPISTNDPEKIYIGLTLGDKLKVEKYKSTLNTWIIRHCKDEPNDQ